MIAHAGRNRWAARLDSTLSTLPVSLHWPRTGDEALSLAATRSMHLAILDDELPDAGGRGVVRGIRRMGLELPCLLVCRDPDERVLRDAIQLDVFSVLEAEAQTDLLPPMIVKAVRRIYHLDWSITGGFN